MRKTLPDIGIIFSMAKKKEGRKFKDLHDQYGDFDTIVEKSEKPDWLVVFDAVFLGIVGAVYPLVLMKVNFVVVGELYQGNRNMNMYGCLQCWHRVTLSCI